MPWRPSFPRRSSERSGANFSIATKLATVALVIVLLSLAVVSVVGISRGRSLANDVNEQRIDSLTVSRAAQVELYMTGLRNQVALLTESPATATAIDELASAAAEESATPAETAAVGTYYEDVVVPTLDRSSETPTNPADLVPASSQSLALQAEYVIESEDDADDEIEDLDESGDTSRGSAYDESHDVFDPVYTDIASNAGFADLYLVDERSDYIAYSVDKGIDFATSLDVGPHSGSTLARIVQQVMTDPDMGVVVADFSSYVPALRQPSLFIAGAVVRDGTTVGAVAARVDASGISSIMTADGDWVGLGQTGESYLVGTDNTIRSEARPFLESPESFLARLAERPSTTDADLSRIETLDTTVLSLPIANTVTRAPRTSGVESLDTVNYLGVEVFSTARVLDVEGVEWTLVFQIAESELDEPVIAYARNLLIAIAVIVVIATFVVVWWSRRVVEPLRRIARRLRVTRQTGRPPDAELEPTMRTPSEFEELSQDIDVIVARWDGRRIEIEDRSNEHRNLLRRFLPPGVVARIEAGETDMLDRVEHATVVTAVVHGLGPIVDQDVDVDSRSVVDRIVDEADEIAGRYGLDRVKLTGDSYTAICGSTRPYLDHASRAVSFALAVVEMVDDVAAEVDVALNVAVGIETGPVTVGVAGGSRLMYDAWGSTVSTSANLARSARTGQIVVTSNVRPLLPTIFVLDDLDDVPDDESTGLARVTGVLLDSETTR